MHTSSSSVYCLSINKEKKKAISINTSYVHTWKSTALLLARSALFPAKAITMLGLACR